MGLHEHIKQVTTEAAAVANLIDHLQKLNLLTEENIELSIESETSLRDVIEKLLDDEAEAEADVAKMAKRIDDLQARKKAYLARKETVRTVIAVALGQAGIPSLRTAFGTVSVKNGIPEVIVINEAEIPVEYFVQPEPVVNKKMLGEAVRSIETNRGKALKILDDVFEVERGLLSEIPDDKERVEALGIKDALYQDAVREIWRKYPAIPGATIGEMKTVIAIRRK